MDKINFVVIIIMTTIISYVFIRRYFKMDPKYLIYASVGIFFGLIIGISIGWPFAMLLGAYGIVVAPYIMGIVLMVFIEFFIIEGRNILIKRRLLKKI